MPLVLDEIKFYYLLLQESYVDANCSRKSMFEGHILRLQMQDIKLFLYY